MKTKIIGLLCGLLVALCASSQGIPFSQFNSIPLYFNPAFAGSVEISRLSFSYRNQWNNRYQTGLLSYDQVVQKLRGGVGLLIYDDYAGKGILNTFYCGVMYAPKFNLSKKIALTPGIKAGYRRMSLRKGDFILDNVYYHNPIETKPANAPDISIGILFNTENAYLGIAVDHINRPDMSLVENGTSKMLVKYNFQAGYTFQKKDTSDFSLSINAICVVLRSGQNLQANIVGRYKWFMLGAAYGNGITGLVGYYNRKFVLGYSLDYYYRDMPQQLRYAHEISLKCFFKLKKKKTESEKK